MRVGDLVQLSSYGEQRLYNSDVKKGSVGIVIKIHQNSAYPYRVLWVNKHKQGHIRRELRHARKTND